MLLFVGNDQNPGMTRRGIKLGSDNKSLIVDLASMPIQLADQNPSIRGFAGIKAAAGESGTDFLVAHSETQYTWNHGPFEITYDTSEHVNLDDAKVIGTQLEQARNLAEKEIGLRLPPELSKGNTIEVFVKPFKGPLGDAPVLNFPGLGNNIRLNSHGAKARDPESVFQWVLDSNVAAHEYFHLVQQSYSTYGAAKLSSWAWLFEASAVYFQYLNLGEKSKVNLWEGEDQWGPHRPKPEHLLKGFVETGNLKDADGNKLSTIEYTRGHFLHFLATEQKRSSAVLKQFLDAMKEGVFKGFYSGIDTSINPSMVFVEEYEKYLLYYLKNFTVKFGGELSGGEKETFSVPPMAGKLIEYHLKSGILSIKNVNAKARISVFGGKISDSIKDAGKREKLTSWENISGFDYPYIFILAFNSSLTETLSLCNVEFTAITAPTSTGTSTGTSGKTLSGITLNPGSKSLNVGETYDLSQVVVTGTYSDGTTGAITSGITWSGTGVSGTTFTAPSTAGTVTLTCTVEGKTQTLTVTVAASTTPTTTKTLTGLELTPMTTSVTTGGTYDLTQVVVKAMYENDPSVTVTNVIWDKQSGAGTVSGTTYTAGSSAGTDVLTCAYTEGGVTKTVVYTVTVTAETTPSGETTTVDLGDGITMYFVEIPVGTFQMGQTGIAEPAHQVTLTKAFYMGKHEVTQEQYEKIVGTNPSLFKNSTSGKQPVDRVNWFGAVSFCNALSTAKGLTPCYKNQANSTTIDPLRDTVTCDWNANGYRLPTEAEWEYACRAGTTTAYYWGDAPDRAYAWYWSDAGMWPHNVGEKIANTWGLHDMGGNVWEWCWDLQDSYSSNAQTDPRGAEAGYSRVIRGGDYGSREDYLRSANRDSGSPRGSYLGFRTLRIIP